MARFGSKVQHKINSQKCWQRQLRTVVKCQQYKPLVVVGSINADIVLKIDRLPKPGETIGASSLEYFPGGKGANQAAAGGRLGYPTTMIGQVGSDSNADFMLDALSNRGVDLSLVRRVQGSTGTAVILLQPSGENSIVIVGGANTKEWDLTQHVMDALGGAGCVLLQREIPDSVNLKIASEASKRGTTVMMDAGGVDEPLSPQILQSLSLLSPNEVELARLTNLPTDTTDEIEIAAKKLLGMGVKGVLVKMGKNGAMFVDDSSYVVQNAFNVENVVDTTGAGDCFTAAFAVGRLEGKDVQGAMEFAAGAAAVCVSRMGAMTSLPSKSETIEFIQGFQ